MAKSSQNRNVQITSLSDLRARITPRQRAILDDVWQHDRDKNAGIPERPLFRKHKSHIVVQETKTLGDSILHSRHSDNLVRYSIGFVGMFLTSDGPRLEGLIKRYLIYLKDRFSDDPEIVRLSSKDLAAWDPPLSVTELNELRAITYRSHGSFASSFGGSNSEEWYITIMTSVVDLEEVTDWDAYISREVLIWYAAGNVVSDADRGTYNSGSGSDVFRSLFPPQKSVSKETANKLDLAFIHDEPLRKILEADWRESNRLVQVRAWKSIIIMCGGILEGLLIWRLENTASENEGKSYEDWMLNELIKKCKGNGLLNKEDEQLTEWARIYRNVIHPANQKKYRRTIERSHAMIALNLVDALASSFRSRATQ